MPVPVWGQGLVLTHSANGAPVEAAAAVAHALVARIEEEEPRFVRAVRVKRRRPVAAAAACVVELRTIAAAGGGQEEALAVGGSELVAIDTVHGGPFGGGVVDEFFPLRFGRRAGAAAELLRGHVVRSLKRGHVVWGAVFSAGIVLGQRLQVTVGINGAVFVRAPVVYVLGFRLAPCVVVAILLGRGGAEVARSPQQAAGQPQVHPLYGGLAAAVVTAIVAVAAIAGGAVVFLLARGKGQPRSHGHKGQKSDCPFHGVVVLSMLSMLIIISSCFFCKVTKYFWNGKRDYKRSLKTP